MQEYIDFIQNNLLLSAAWAGILVMLIINIVKSKTAGFKEVTAAQVTHFINREEGVVADVRSQDEFRAGHIAGALHILPTDIKSGTVPALEKRKSNPIIVVCKSGTAAQESAGALVKAGFEQVYLLKGGLLAWEDAKMPLVRGKK
jgi:rhodanese-related sulfurtransferase